MNFQGDTAMPEGYRMPAEWERHEATWLSWPKDPVTFPGKSLRAVERVFTEAIRFLQKGEKVFVLVDDGGMEDYVRERLRSSGLRMTNVFFYRIKSVDVWIRDYGPFFLKNKQTAEFSPFPLRFTLRS